MARPVRERTHIAQPELGKLRMDGWSANAGLAHIRPIQAHRTQVGAERASRACGGDQKDGGAAVERGGPATHIFVLRSYVGLTLRPPG